MAKASDLILIPAMGADARLYARMRRWLPGFRVARMHEPARDETLAEYGEKLAQRLTPHAPRWIGGSSMGGMLAQEVARHLDVRGVLIMCSARSGRDLPRRSHHLNRVGRWTPEPLLDIFVRNDRILHYGIRGLPRDVRVSLIDQWNTWSTPALKWCGEAILNWPGAGKLHAPVRHLHGSHDPVIPAERTRPTEVVPGGHFLPITQPRLTADWVIRQMEEIEAGRESMARP